jgi:hypothetical protein
MRIDMREHQAIRDQVHAGLSALRVQGRQIWGDTRHPHLSEIGIRLMVGVGDLARLARDQQPGDALVEPLSSAWRRELKKELGEGPQIGGRFHRGSQ